MDKQSHTSISTLITTDPAENEWKRLFVATEHWQSDFKFFSDELQFFRSLMDRHFMKLIDPENFDSTKATVARMGKLENRRYNFEQKLNRHYHHMTDLVKNPFPHDAEAYREEHFKLEKAMTDFVKDFRELKREVFKLARHVMDAEKNNHLLTS